MTTKTDDRSLEDILFQEVEAPSFQLHDEDEWVGATLDRVEKTEGQYGPQLKWIFIEDDELGKGNGQDGKDREEWFFTPTKLTTSDKNKYRKMVKWLTGEFPAEGQRPDLRPYIGGKVKLMFEHYQATSDGAPVTKDRISRVKAA